MILDGRFLRFDYYRFCRALRTDGVDVPLLLILGEGDQAERGTGVNVTLREPFTSVKLINRVVRLLPEQSDDVLTVGEIILDLEKRTVSRGKSNHRLTPKQAALLEIFMRHPGKVLSRAFLMKQIWDTDFVGDTRTLEVHIHWLRRAVEENPSRPIYLTTVRRQGYCFDVPHTNSSRRS
jgi:DNA-binding response OmpR family regulator